MDLSEIPDKNSSKKSRHSKSTNKTKEGKTPKSWGQSLDSFYRVVAMKKTETRLTYENTKHHSGEISNWRPKRSGGEIKPRGSKRMLEFKRTYSGSDPVKQVTSAMDNVSRNSDQSLAEVMGRFLATIKTPRQKQRFDLGNDLKTYG